MPRTGELVETDQPAVEDGVFVAERTHISPIIPAADDSSQNSTGPSGVFRFRS